ncbi:hypothetical protein B0920_02200 [Massilia sp. KIM]|uniref:helix-turn-helix domain-containing protein n=1 Tax=Massilia sp. KIM TaxID=1955422 RepID=UPI00098FDBF2|nr:helix-turn-helix transcriptional regulator [Massilia sp. KIM]OON62310.1 hypothetical protein B0920_02200 [Massilia sp. KIM]
MTTTSEPRWLALMREEAGRTSMRALADRLNYSRTTVSLVLSGTYPGQTDKIAAKAIEVLETPAVVDCPYLGQELPSADCRAYAMQRAPTHHPTKMAHWRACQKCQNNCKGEQQ